MSRVIPSLVIITSISIVIFKMLSPPSETQELPFRNSPPTIQEKRWDSCEIKASQVFRIDKAIALYLDHKSRYVAIEKMRTGGVPSAVIFTLHGRESTWNFRRHLHEGSRLTGRTLYVPKGRPKRGTPPFTFEESAEDALYVLKNLESRSWDVLHNALQAIEEYNGLGYQLYHKDVPSPYLWSGTKHYQRGKYIADGKFSRTAVDKQLGCAAILRRMLDRGIKIGFL